ncbi:MAG: DoxX family protein [Elstera sp.]
MSDTQRTDLALLLLRVSLGVMAFAHGFLLKVLVFTPAGTAKFFESVGYPAFFAYIIILAETLGGLALIAGVFTRLAAVGLIPILIGATLMHAGNGWVFSTPNGGWEFPAFWTVALVVQALLGPGGYSLGRLLPNSLPGLVRA